MSCVTCKCDAGLSNTGISCTPIMQVAKKIILVPYFDSAGNINSIDLATATLTQAFFDGLVNQTDKTKRWFPLPEMKNVKDERAENKIESFEDGSSVFIADGDRSFTGLLVKGTPQLKGKIEAARCVEVGVFIVDKSGGLIGSNKQAGKLIPIKIDEASISANLMKTTDATIQKLEVKYNFHSDERDEDLRMITCSEMTFDILQLKGLLDIHVAYSAITTTGFKAKLTTDYGTPKTPVVDKGLILADFNGLAPLGLNKVGGAHVVITSVVESPDGTYTFAIPLQTAGNFTLTPSKNGRDYADVSATQFTIV